MSIQVQIPKKTKSVRKDKIPTMNNANYRKDYRPNDPTEAMNLWKCYENLVIAEQSMSRKKADLDYIGGLTMHNYGWFADFHKCMSQLDDSNLYKFIEIATPIIPKIMMVMDLILMATYHRKKYHDTRKNKVCAFCDAKVKYLLDHILEKHLHEMTIPREISVAYNASKNRPSDVKWAADKCEDKPKESYYRYSPGNRSKNDYLMHIVSGLKLFTSWKYIIDEPAIQVPNVVVSDCLQPPSSTNYFVNTSDIQGGKFGQETFQVQLINESAIASQMIIDQYETNANQDTYMIEMQKKTMMNYEYDQPVADMPTFNNCHDVLANIMSTTLDIVSTEPYVPECTAVHSPVPEYIPTSIIQPQELVLEEQQAVVVNEPVVKPYVPAPRKDMEKCKNIIDEDAPSDGEMSSSSDGESSDEEESSDDINSQIDQAIENETKSGSIDKDLENYLSDNASPLSPLFEVPANNDDDDDDEITIVHEIMPDPTIPLRLIPASLIKKEKTDEHASQTPENMIIEVHPDIVASPRSEPPEEKMDEQQTLSQEVMVEQPVSESLSQEMMDTSESLSQEKKIVKKSVNKIVNKKPSPIKRPKPSAPPQKQYKSREIIDTEDSSSSSSSDDEEMSAPPPKKLKKTTPPPPKKTAQPPKSKKPKAPPKEKKTKKSNNAGTGVVTAREKFGNYKPLLNEFSKEFLDNFNMWTCGTKKETNEQYRKNLKIVNAPLTKLKPDTPDAQVSLQDINLKHSDTLIKMNFSASPYWFVKNETVNEEGKLVGGRMIRATFEHVNKLFHKFKAWQKNRILLAISKEEQTLDDFWKDQRAEKEEDPWLDNEIDLEYMPKKKRDGTMSSDLSAEEFSKSKNFKTRPSMKQLFATQYYDLLFTTEELNAIASIEDFPLFWNPPTKEHVNEFCRRVHHKTGFSSRIILEPMMNMFAYVNSMNDAHHLEEYLYYYTHPAKQLLSKQTQYYNMMGDDEIKTTQFILLIIAEFWHVFLDSFVRYSWTTGSTCKFKENDIYQYLKVCQLFDYTMLSNQVDFTWKGLSSKLPTHVVISKVIFSKVFSQNWGEEVHPQDLKDMIDMTERKLPYEIIYLYSIQIMFQNTCVRNLMTVLTYRLLQQISETIALNSITSFDKLTDLNSHEISKFCSKLDFAQMCKKAFIAAKSNYKLCDENIDTSVRGTRKFEYKGK